MNTLFNAWQLAGWTMVLFLAAGTALLIFAGAVRLLLRRTNANVRYGASLLSFVALAMLPMLIVGTLASRQRQQPELTTKDTKVTKEELNADTFVASRERQRPETKTDLATEVTEKTGINSSLIATVDPQIDFEGLLNQIIAYLPWVWIVGTPLTFLFLASGLIGAERLRRSCQLLPDGPIHVACEELRGVLKISRKVGVAICDSITSPLVVGVVKPLILLPPAAITGWSPEHLEMVLVHELAHVRRWDNGVNLFQRVVESLLFFHPAVWIVSGWVRRDREDCCDAVVVRHTSEPQAYAELLLALASHQPLAGLATSAAMARHPVASRIRRILKLQDEPMLVSRQALGFLASAVLACVLAVGFFTPSDAEEASRKRERPEVSREAERSAVEREETTTKNTKDTKEDLATEVTESTEEDVNAESAKEAKDDAVTRRVYVLDEYEGGIKELFKAVGGLRETHVMTKDGKEMLVVGANESGHKKLRSLLENIQGSATSSLFPTLEDQRAADLAYKLLGVELEKLTPEDLERVKAKGYEGGLRAIDGGGSGMGGSPLSNGDLLVGLHVWPTESFEDVTEILSRDDLDQLTPMKFYVLRQTQPSDPADSWPDEVVTGRIEVTLDAWRNLQELNAANPILKISDPIIVVAYDENELIRTGKEVDIINDAFSINEDGTVNFGPTYGKVRIAGKTFGEAGKLIRKHLSTKIANCAVKVAPATQGLSFTAPPEFTATPDPGPPLEQPQLQGDGDKQPKEASQDIYMPVDPDAKVDLSDSQVVVYDGKTFDQWRQMWRSELKTEKRTECIKALAAFGRAGMGQEAAEAILDVAGEYDFRTFSDGSAGDLKQAITEVLIGNEGFPGQYWLPLLKERLQTDPDKWSYFAHQVLSDVQGKDVIPYLRQLAKNESLSVEARGAALAGLGWQPDIADDPEAVEMVREALRGDKPEMQVFNKLRFHRLDLIPEQYDLLFHEDPQIRNTSINIVRGGGGDIEPVLSKLLEILDDPTRNPDHEKAVIALYRLNGYFINIPERRQPIVDKIKEILVSSDTKLLPASLALASTLSAKAPKIVINELGDKITDDRHKELEAAIEQAENLESDRAFGGGGMSGGGMF